jgi:hypothetical protein
MTKTKKLTADQLAELKTEVNKLHWLVVKSPNIESPSWYISVEAQIENIKKVYKGEKSNENNNRM